MPFNLGTIWSEIGLDTRKLDAGLMAAQTKLATADHQINTMGQSLTNNSTKFMMAGGLMVGAVAAVGIASVKTAAQFETSMRNVNSISKLSEDQFKKQADAVLTLSTKLPQSAKTLADGLYDIASSGFAGADGLKVLEASAKAASAGMTTTATSAKGVTAVLNAYGLEADKASQVSDTMFRTVDKGVITFEELSSTVGDWIGMAKAANLTFEEASGAIAYMTTKGIGAAEAGTSLQRMLTGIIKPTDEMAAVIKNAGYESGEMMLKTLGLTGSMQVLNDATGGSITKLIELIPEIRGVRGANALLGAGYEELTGFMENFNNTAGATDIALKEQSKSLEYQMKLLKNNANAVVIALGSELIPTVNKYVKNLTEFIQVHKEGISELAKFGGGSLAAVGSVLLLAGAIGKLRLAFITLNTAITGSAVLGLTSQLLLLAGAAAVWGDAIRKVVISVEEEKDGADDLNEALDSLSVRMAIEQADGKVSIEVLDKHFTALEKLANQYPEAAKEVMALSDELTKGNITIVEAKDATEDLYQKYHDMPAVMATYDKYMGETTESTVEAKMATQDHENAVAALAAQYPNLTAEEVEAVVAQDEINAAMQEGAGAADKQTKSVDNLRSSFNQLINDIFGGITTYNDFQEASWAVEEAEKAVTEAIKQYGEGSREAEQALNDLDATNLTAIETAFKLSTQIGVTTEKQEEARLKAIELGSQYVSTGAIGSSAFISMASQFGLSINDMIGYAKNLNNELDALERERIIRITTIQMNEMGFHKAGEQYASGGIVGMPNIPKAAYGMVIPQTGRAIPILAHEGEMILNDSQQGNLINALWGVANGKSIGASGDININFNEPVYIREQADIDNLIEGITNKIKTKQIGIGMR